MSQRINTKRLHEFVKASKDETTEQAPEVLALLYEQLLKLPEMPLANGMTARVEAYYSPQTDESGELHCGIDVRLSSGDLLEFTIKNTGWERAFAGRQQEHLRHLRR